MPLSLADVTFHKSGTTMLGGAIGAAIASQVVAQPAVITGVYISKAFGNALNLATLSYNPVTQMLSWRPQGSASTTFSSAITTSGSYTIGAPATGMIVVTVTYEELPTSYKVESIMVSAPLHTVFDETLAQMALAGDVQYRCLYFRNNHPTLSANDVRLYLHRPPTGAQTIALGVDPAGVGNGLTTGVAQVVATAWTPPAGVAFSAPVFAADGLPLGTVGPNQSVAFWQRRSTPPMAYGPLEVVATTVGVALVG